MLPKKSVFLLFLLPFLPLFGSVPDSLVQQQLKDRGEVYFSFAMPEAETLSYILAGVSLDKMDGDSVYVYANRRGYAWFGESGLPLRLLNPPGAVDFDLRMKGPEALKTGGLLQEWDFYPTYEAYLQIMADFEKDYPELCQVTSIGKSVMGRDLLFARIAAPEKGGARAPGHTQVPRFMYTSTMHGDETAGFVLSLRLIHHLLSQYGKDERITRLLEETEIWICPNENPDGTYRYDNSTVYGASRGNINGVDLNRNYPNPVVNPLNEMQAETSAMIQFVDTMGFVMSANMHGGIELVNYPFDSWTSSQNRHADHDWWRFVLQEFVDTVHRYSPPGYMTGLGTGMTHGGDWYVVYGSRQDYLNYFLSSREFTLELSNQKIPQPAQLPALWENTHRSLVNYIWQSTYGLSGLVSDAVSAAPISAQLQLPGHDKDNSEVQTRARSGFFQRPLLAGNYDLLVSASGYPDLLYPNLQVHNYETLWLEIPMGRLAFDPQILDFEPALLNGSSLRTLIVHNPGSEGIQVSLDGISGDANFLVDLPAKSLNFFLAPGESRLVPIRFSPAGVSDYEAVLHIGTDPGDGSQILVPMRGQAVEEAGLIHPLSDLIDFGQVETGTMATQTFSLKNAGNLVVQIDSAWVADPVFSLVGDFPVSISPGETIEWQVEFHPTTGDNHVSALTISSDAFNNDGLSVRFMGMGNQPTALPEFPVADQPVFYPNPFFSQAMLHLHLLSAGKVTADLYDLQGRLVDALFDAHLSAGIQEVALPAGRDGRIPGLYILRVTTPQAVYHLNVVRVKSD
jgi:hypothetical protein